MTHTVDFQSISCVNYAGDNHAFARPLQKLMPLHHSQLALMRLSRYPDTVKIIDPSTALRGATWWLRPAKELPLDMIVVAGLASYGADLKFPMQLTVKF